MTWKDAALADTPGLLWMFDETSGAVITDYSGNGRHGVYEGPVLYDQGSIAPSGEGSSISALPGPADNSEIGFYKAQASGLPIVLTGNYVEVALELPASLPDGWVAYVLSFQVVGVGAFNVVAGKDPSFGATGALIQVAGDDGVDSWSATGTITPGEPFLLAVEHDGTEIAMYVNGEMAVSPLPGTYPSPPAAWTGSEPLSGLVGGPSFNQGHRLGGLAIHPIALGATRAAERYAAWAETTPPTIAYGRSSATAEIEVSLLDFIYSEGAGSASSGSSVESELLGAHYMGGFGGGHSAAVMLEWERSLEREGSGSGEITLLGATGDYSILGTGTGAGSGTDSQSGFSLFIYDTEHRRAPTALTVSVAGAIPGGTVEFWYNDDEVFATAQVDDSGSIGVISLEVYSMEAGEHTLKARDDTGREAWANFTLLYRPTTPKTVSHDADPIEVPGAANADGTWNWVLQDLMPGGLGSYIFKRNPVSMDKPMFQRTLSGQRSTHPAGRHHIFEGHDPTWEWRFTGVAFTQDDQEKLYAFLDLNRRFYLIDHRNRAWVCTFTQVEMVPRLRKTLVAAGEPAIVTDWLADYTVTAINHEKQWRTPVPLEDE